MRLYLDTNVISFASRIMGRGLRRARRLQSRRLLELASVGRFLAVVSPVTLAEIRATPGARMRGRMLRLLEDYRVQLLSADEGVAAFRLARLYRRAGVVPEWAISDSQHLAWATVTGADVLVSWNRRQMVRLQTRRRVAILNAALEYEPIDIQMPTEVLSEAEGE